MTALAWAAQTPVVLTSDYEIVIAGELPADCVGQFAPLQVWVGGGRTVLRAQHIDQPALHGIIAHIAALGLTLVGVSLDGVSLDGVSLDGAAAQTYCREPTEDRRDD